MEITLDIPEDLAVRLKSRENELARIIELGLREVNASGQEGFKGLTELLERFADLPSPEEIMALRPSEELEKRIHDLLDKNREEGLTSEEENEWAQYELLEHVVRLAKSKAALKLNTS